MHVRMAIAGVAVVAIFLRSPATAADFVPLLAQAGAALVQPGGLQELANQAARPEMVQAEPPPADAPPDEDAAADAEPAPASPFELRYFIAYLLILVCVGGGTALVARPSGRKPQADPKPPKQATAKVAAKK